MAESNISLMAAQMAVDGDQNDQIKLHRKHIQAIWRHLEKLENFITVDENMLAIEVGESKIYIVSDGSIRIEGKTAVVIASGGKITIKAFRDVDIKGSKINQN